MSATVRAATLKDAERIYALVRRNADMLVPRSLGNIVESIDRLFVAEAEGETVGCAGYQIHPEIGDPEAAAVEGYDKLNLKTGLVWYLENYLKQPFGPNRSLAQAVEAGITDGSNPMQLIPRYQAAIMALNAKEG